MQETRMHTNEQRANDDGFSLIEVLIAIVILTIGLLSLAQMMVLSTNANTLSGKMTSCSALANENMERLKATPFFSNPAAFTRNAALVAGGDINATVGGYSATYDSNGNPGGNVYLVRWQITDVPSPLPLQMIQIQMRCLPAGGNQDPFAIISEANFVSFRTANVG